MSECWCVCANALSFRGGAVRDDAVSHGMKIPAGQEGFSREVF